MQMVSPQRNLFGEVPMTTPHATRPSRRAPKLVKAPSQTAQQAIGTLTPGCRVIGFTKGQFSLIDLVRAVLEQTGPAHLTVSTWSTGIKDAENVQWLRENGVVLSCLLLLDYSFPNMRAGRDNATSVLDAFGKANIRCARNHAKFVLIRNAEWNIAIRSSMNLNRNPRFEQFDIDDDGALCDFFAEVVEEVFQETPPGWDVEHKDLNATFVNALGGGVSDVYKLGDDLDEDARLSAMLRAMNE